jgi:hypothetical protein
MHYYLRAIMHAVDWKTLQTWDKICYSSTVNAHACRWVDKQADNGLMLER